MATVVLVPQTVNVTVPMPIHAFAADKTTGIVSEVTIPADVLMSLGAVETWMMANNITLISTGYTGT